jgi:hypothetical protein
VKQQKPDGRGRPRAEALAQARRLTCAADLIEGFIEDDDVPHGHLPHLALALAKLVAATEEVLGTVESAASAAPRPKPGGNARPWQLRNPRRPGA